MKLVTIVRLVAPYVLLLNCVRVRFLPTKYGKLIGLPFIKFDMKANSSQPLRCWHCRFYQPDRQQSGCCQMLNVTVQGRWQACGLYAPVFNSDQRNAC